MKKQAVISKGIYWKIALASAVAAGMVFSIGTQFRLGFQFGTFGREFAFGFLFTLLVWWYNTTGYPILEGLLPGHFRGSRWSRVLRVLSTLFFSFAIVWLDERAQVLHIDQDLSGYVQPEYANEFRGMVTAGMVMLLFFFLDTMRKYYQTRMQVEQLKLENSNARFEVLKQQVSPHFLFNALNILKTMVKNSDPVSEEYVIRLSDLYRTLLLSHQKEKVTLEEELAVLENYLFMLKARFGDKLVVSNRLKTNGKATCLPPLTLQMLVENCIKHNVVSADHPLHIELFEEDNCIVVRNKIQVRRSVEGSNRVGLDNIRQRYQALGGRAIGIDQNNEYFTVRLPVIYN